jgi:hypothetical protein
MRDVLLEHRLRATFCNILPNVELLSVRASRVLLSDLASLYPAVLHFSHEN